VAEGETTIAAADSVAISYPAFWDHLAALAA
jgi:5-enolpyruvylshikimate-3-phosphate synthase